MGFDDYLRAAAAPALTILGQPCHGVLSWNLTDRCNYRCAYCTQRKNGERSRVLPPLAELLPALDALPGRWEFKFSGGEPFCEPQLLPLAAALVRRGHLLSLQTNFSATDAQLGELLEATAGRLHLFSASLHLDYATPAHFLARYRRLIRPHEAHGLRFGVTSVATPARLVELQARVAPLFAREGVAFKVQPQKEHGLVIPYDEAQQRLLLALGGHNGTGRIANGFAGRLCHAGARYLVIKSSGQAWRCYAASRAGGKYAGLGSLQQGLTLLDGPRPCPYPQCICTVPIQRGLIDGLPPRAHEPGE